MVAGDRPPEELSGASLYAVRRLSLGVTLIVLASAVLLLSDRERRATGASAGRVSRVAIVQHASSAPIDEGVQGTLRDG